MQAAQINIGLQQEAKKVQCEYASRVDPSSSVCFRRVVSACNVVSCTNTPGFNSYQLF